MYYSCTLTVSVDNIQYHNDNCAKIRQVNDRRQILMRLCLLSQVFLGIETLYLEKTCDTIHIVSLASIENIS